MQHSNNFQLNVNCEINLPLSKSLSNRQIMLHALRDISLDKLEISTAQDSKLLVKLLNKINKNEEILELNCENAGTVLRFLVPFLASKQKTYFVTGSERMLKRPIGDLVETLISMNANIKFADKENFPPIIISPSSLKINTIEIDITKSSQFASALLMLLPKLSNETSIYLKGTKNSFPYIKMTLDLMKIYGIKYSIQDNKISIKGSYKEPQNLYVCEKDWSSASYWYESLAITGCEQLFLKGLKINSLQGDAEIVKIFEKLGVKSYQKNDGVLIRKEGEICENININFQDTPDIAPAIIVTLAAMNIKAKLKGLATLNLKESNRMDVISEELKKIGYNLIKINDDEYQLYGENNMKILNLNNHKIKTYDDHRMVMAFAPLLFINSSLEIQNKEAVTKSYSGFWNEFLKLRNLINLT